MLESRDMLLLATGALPGWLFPPLFVLGLVGISFFASVKGGWSGLAKRYRTSAPRPDLFMKMSTGRMGWTHYNRCLTVGASEAGLYLAMMPSFTPFHPPLLIPWSEIKERRRETSQFQRVETLVIGPDRTVVRIEALVMDGLGRYLPRLEPGLRQFPSRGE
ncbi:hypothetical protein OWM54_03375 [Myxococcus sp. MISCRS1]|uniref:hypothetical protein n=1 Tax=Myxococcus TaxID=32 RepID=UPI00226F9DAA|nr:hypothetical protein [Myxococcus sp. MISCRS1]MCY0996170.1 hypothetical protein [Myxococcus sp. MISCRS1]